MNKHLGVEIGGTKQQIAVGSAEGDIFFKESVKLDYKRGAEDILDWINKKAIGLIKEYSDIDSIGVGFGGPLESATGRVLCSLQVPGWKDFKLKEWFEKSFGKRTVVVNDTVTGGIAELKRGAGIGSKRLFYTNIGTGIGGGLYIDGEYYDGSGFGASYLGNSLVPDKLSKVPGKAVRLELICSGKSIEKRLCSENYVPQSSSLYKILRENSSLCAKDLAEEAKAGDSFAVSELMMVAETFSVGLANVLALEGPDRIVIGGGVAKMGDILFDALRKYTDEYAFIANKGRYEIVPSMLMDDAVLIGAVIAAEMFKD